MQNTFSKENLTTLGLKATKPRLAILEILRIQKKPADVSKINEYLKKNKVSANPATVYRILDAFNKKGIVAKIELQEGKFRYEMVGKDHHHIICENCGKIEDVSDCSLEKLEKEIVKKKKFQVLRHSLEFYGLCPDCKKRATKQ